MSERALDLLRLDKLTLADALDIFLVAILIYYTFDAVRGTRAAQMLLGILLLFGAFVLTGALHLRTLHTILEHAIRYIPFIVIVVFQAEIRRALTAVGKYPLFRFIRTSTQGDDVLSEVVFAATTLSSQKIGALIVFQRSHRLKSYVESGIELDAVVSYDLLLNIFSPETPLHDGAAMICDGRIVAASCFLPLTLQASLSKQYGTRHRAAVGITEETDAVAVVVSEETGAVSVAADGQITTGLWAEALQQHLRTLLGTAPDAKPRETQAAGA